MSAVVSVGSAERDPDGFGTSFSTTFKRKSGSRCARLTVMAMLLCPSASGVVQFAAGDQTAGYTNEGGFPFVFEGSVCVTSTLRKKQSGRATM